MAKVNNNLMLASYITDFGQTLTSLPVKFSAEAPIPEETYSPRDNQCRGAAKAFKPRYLKAQFSTGTYKYVLGSIANLLALKDALVAEGATCIDLIGEQWNFVPDTQISGGTYKTTPYTAASITGAGDKETGSFTYTSDAFGALKLGYIVESTNAALLTAAKAGMATPIVGGQRTRANNSIVTPRSFAIYAPVDDGTNIVRNSPSSTISDLGTHATAIKPAAFALGYQGESARGVEILAANPAT